MSDFQFLPHVPQIRPPMQSADMGVGEESVNPTQSVLHPIATVLDLTDIPASGVRDYFLYHPYDGHLEAAYVSVPESGTFADFSIQIIQKQGNRVIAESTEERIGSITTDARELNLPASFGEGGVFARVRYTAAEEAGADFSANLLLDDYPGAEAAYSVRLIDKDYSGPCMRVRNVNDNSTADIGFTADGDLNEADIAALCGSYNGAVEIWYDQSGGGHHQVQETTTLQPFIYLGSDGTVLKENGKPVIVFTDGGQLQNVAHSTVTVNIMTSFTSTTPNPGYTFSVVGPGGDYSTYSNFMIGTTTGGGTRFGFCTTTGTGTPDQNMTCTHTVNQATQSSPTQAQLYAAIDPQAVVTTEWVSTDASARRWHINYNYAFAGSLQVQEYVIYYSDKSSDQAAIENAINTYYGAYVGEDAGTTNPAEPEPTKMFLTLHVRTGEIT